MVLTCVLSICLVIRITIMDQQIETLQRAVNQLQKQEIERLDEQIKQLRNQ